MANKTMHHLVIEDNNYEILDAKNRANIAAEYSASSTYAVGDVVLYNGQLYKCTTAITTAEAWTAAHWTAVTVGEKIADLNGQISTNAQNITQLQTDTTTLKDDLETVQTDLAQTTSDALAAYATDTASGAIASFPDGADNVPVKSLKVNIEPVQSGSGDPSPDNVRPISGHSAAVVTRTGRNLIPSPNSQVLNGITVTHNNDGSISITGTASDGTTISGPSIGKLKSGTYTISISEGLPENVWVSISNSPKLTTYRNSIVKTGTVDAIDNAYVHIYINKGVTIDTTLTIMLEVGNAATAYEPYTAQTVTISLNGTRYGGTLDATTGVLTVTRGYVKLSDLTDWGNLSSLDRGVMRHLLTNAAAPQNTVPTTAIMSNRKAKGHGPITASDTDSFAISPAAVVVIPMGRAITTEEFITECGNDQLCYPLATPQTVQLTAQEIKTVLGQNNVWNDCADTEVEYRADTKLYIEKLTVPTEDDMIADHAISANSFFMIGNTLYRATTAIASGATITVGTNATKLSLSDALNALA